MRIRIATWNVHSCVGTDGRLDPDRVADVIATLDADFVALQEVDSRAHRTGGVNQLALLERRLGLHALAGPCLIASDGDFGNALLSRQPAVAVSHIDLSIAGLEPRGAIDARFDQAGAQLRIVATHLGLSRHERRRQIARLNEALTGAAEDVDGAAATVLLGDFNEWRPGALSRVRIVGRRPAAISRVRSFPSRAPLLRLDRIMVEPQPSRFVPRARSAGPVRVASDHLPVVADLEWPEIA